MGPESALSFDADAMDFVLALAAGVVPGLTTSAEFKPHADINAFELPYAMAFNPITDVDHDIWRQNDSRLSFSLEILAAAGPGVVDDVRAWVDSINLALKADPTMGELCFDSYAPSRGVDETSIRERVVGGMAFSVQFFDMWEAS